MMMHSKKCLMLLGVRSLPPGSRGNTIIAEIAAGVSTTMLPDDVS